MSARRLLVLLRARVVWSSPARPAPVRRREATPAELSELLGVTIGG